MGEHFFTRYKSKSYVYSPLFCRGTTAFHLNYQIDDRSFQRQSSPKIFALSLGQCLNF